VIFGRGKKDEVHVLRLSVPIPADLRPNQTAMSDDDRYFVMQRGRLVQEGRTTEPADTVAHLVHV